MYENLPASEKWQALVAIAGGKHPEAKPLMLQVLASGDSWKSIGPAAMYFGETKDSSAVPSLVSVYLKTADRDSRKQILRVLNEIAQPQHAGDMLSVLRVSEIDQAESFFFWFTQHFVPLNALALKNAIGNMYSYSPKLSSTLSILGDRDGLIWAMNDLKGGARDVNYQIIAHSPLPEAEQWISEALLNKKQCRFAQDHSGI